MPNLYGITGNTTGVAVGNTTGLYQQPTGNVVILNGAGTLLGLLSNTGTVGFALTNSGSQVLGSVNSGASLNLSNLTLSSNLVINGGLYVEVNGTQEPIAIGTAVTTANVVPLSGSDISVPTVGNTTIMTFTLPGAGSWRVDTIVDGYTNDTGSIGFENTLYTFVTDPNGNLVPNSYVTVTGIEIAVPGALIEGTGTGSFFVTTSGPTTYTLCAQMEPGSLYGAVVKGSSTGVTRVVYQSLNPNFIVNNISTANTITAGSITTGNILTNNYLFANGQSIFNSIGPGSYGNTQVAAYLAVGNDPTILAIDANITAANAAIVSLQSNAAVQETEISGLRANITAANAAIVTVQNNLNTFETYANAAYATQSNVGTIYTHLNTLDANVGAYEIANNANVGTIYTHLNTLDANVGAYETYANVTYATQANLTSFETYANATFATGSTYSNANVATFLGSGFGSNTITTTGNITAGNIITTNVIGSARYFSGNLAGNVLYDGVNYRLFANAYPLSTPSAYTILGTNGNNFIGGQTVPTYTAGVLQPPQFGYTTGGAQTIGLLATANVVLATGGGTGVHTTLGHTLYQQVSINSAMNNNDRIRGVGNAVDIILNGQNYGSGFNYTVQTGPIVVGLFGTAAATGPGNLAGLSGAFLNATMNPGLSGSSNIAYATGVIGSAGWNTPATVASSAIFPSTIGYARSFNAQINGLANGNLTINNAVGLHVSNTWASTGTITNKYSILVDDTASPIQTASNINMISGTSSGFNSAGVFTATALNAVTGKVGQFAAVSNGSGKNGGQLAYWDTTNSRWSWFDTNLAVS